VIQLSANQPDGWAIRAALAAPALEQMPEMSQDLPNVDAFSFGRSAVNPAAIEELRRLRDTACDRDFDATNVALRDAQVEMLTIATTNAEDVLYQLATFAELVKADISDDELVDTAMRTIAEGVRGLAL
jgi:hypothetical protein